MPMTSVARRNLRWLRLRGNAGQGLVDAGILTRDKRGVWAYYGLVPAAMNALAAVLSTTCYTVSGM
jgi:hypothetical protein